MNLMLYKRDMVYIYIYVYMCVGPQQYITIHQVQLSIDLLIYIYVIKRCMVIPHADTTMPGPLYHRLSSQRRTVLICVMVMILGGSYMVEQPGSSVMPKYKRWVWLSRISKVSRLPMVQVQHAAVAYMYIYIYLGRYIYI